MFLNIFLISNYNFQFKISSKDPQIKKKGKILLFIL